MADPSAIKSQGTQFQVGDGADPEVFASVGKITDFNGPGGSASVIDATSLESTAKEKIMGLMDEGQFSFDMNLAPSDVPQARLRTLRKNSDLGSFKLILVDEAATTLSFSGYVLEFSIGGGVDDKIKASCKVEITGEVVWS